MGVQYWKSTKSFLPAADEDGIVGLTFSPSGEMNSLTHHSAYTNKMQRSSVNQMNDFNNEHNANAAFDHATKDGLFHNIKSGAGGGKGGESSTTASCSSSSSNAGDTSSSCGSTAASSVRVTHKRRSRTFTLALPSAHRTAALIRKNFMQTFRNIG